MFNPGMIVLYVSNILNSTAFYTQLFNKEPIQTSPGFVLFALESGMQIGLWASQNVRPSGITGGGTEIIFTVTSSEAVDTLLNDWKNQGVTIIMNAAPVDFGYTFLATDPDQHRLRVLALPQ